MVAAQKIAVLLGGRKAFSKPIRSDLELSDQVNLGLPVFSLDHMLALHLLSKVEIVKLIISARTLARRKKEKRLSKEESDRLARVARIVSYAEEVMGQREKAQTWLRRPNRTLHDQAPLDLLETDSGARAVETVLARIEHGIYS